MSQDKEITLAPDPHRRKAKTPVKEHKRICAARKSSDPQCLLQELDIHHAAAVLPAEVRKGKRRVIQSSKQQYARLFEKYASLFEFAPVGYLELDPKGIICEANASVTHLLGTLKSQVIGQPITDFIQPADQDAFNLEKLHCLQDLHTGSCELTMRKAGGAPFAARMDYLALAQPNGLEPHIRITLTDISNQVSMARSLSLSHKCLELVSQATDSESLLQAFVSEIKAYVGCDAVGIRLKDAEGNIPYQAYEGFSQQFYDSESPLSLHTDQCLCIEVIRGKVDKERSHCTAAGSIFINSTSRFLADLPRKLQGTTRNVCHSHGYESVALVPIPIDDCVQGLIHIADRRENRVPPAMVFELEKAAVRMGLALQRFQIQHQLNQSLADQRDLSARLLKAQEEEQRRIAMDLHDQTGQDLNVLKLRLAAIGHKLRKDQTGLKDECWQVMEFASRIIDDVRRIAHGLNPSLLEILGLRAALQQLIRDFSRGNRIQVITETEALEMVRDRSSQLTLYRIIQEALTNASKHAKAATVRIIARVADTRLKLFIQDDGQGFDLLHFRDARKGQRGMGLDAMALRARMIGAEWNIVSHPGQGTQITLSLPLDLETFT